jgi:hypothetical protein
MKRNGLVALSDLANEANMPSRATLFALVKAEKIPHYKFPGDRKTYVHRIDIERAVKTPRRKGRK